ncbi:putative faint sausage [Penaeus vannamei]|uniref:Putative faint sausage n=1 Tax=Penaeus vannamei TaxID=6689 RepID=A0A3R7QH71_PENVA|nr:putative faint sausage [Penaeus vannamei]
MGVSHWLLALLLYYAAVSRASEVRYLRHSGRRESGGEPAAGSLGLSAGLGLGGLNNATENPIDLLFEDEADPSAGLKEELVVRGQEVVFECVVAEDAKVVEGDDSVEGEVRWYHDGSQIKGDLRMSIMWTGRLVMSHAVSADSGVWWCAGARGARGRVRLVVTIPPERPYLEYGDARLAAGGRLTTRQGNSITLNCVVEEGTGASIAWVLGGEDISPLQPARLLAKPFQMRSEWRAEEGVFYSTSNLTLPSVEKELHNSSVACVVRHPALPVPVPVPLRLNVQYPPAFRLRRWPMWGTPVREGASISLLCAVDANPPSSPTWVKVTERGTTEVASSGGWLNLTRIGFTHLRRVISFSLREFRSTATVPTIENLKKVAPPRVVEVGVGEAVQIPCISPISNVPTAVCWTKILEDTLPCVLTQTRLVVVEHRAKDCAGGRTASVSSQNSLLLRKTTYSDGGRYRCVASDATRTVESDDVDVVVTGAPVVEAVTLRCSLSAAAHPHRPRLRPPIGVHPHLASPRPPPARETRRDERQVQSPQPHGNMAETPDCQYAVMTIVGVRASDAGNWVLVGVNDRGASAALIRLNITAAAHSVTANGARAMSHAHSAATQAFLAAVLILFYAARDRLWA